MNRPETQNQPSVDELLVSIRQAIHGDSAKSASAKNENNTGVLEQKMAGSTRTNNTLNSERPAVSASMSQTRVSLRPKGRSKSSVGADQHTENFFKLRNQLQAMGAKAPHDRAANSGGHSQGGSANGFAGILNGDTRLEDALAKLKRAGLDENEGNDNGGGEVQDSPLLRTYTAETPETEFTEYEEAYENDDFEDVHPYTSEYEPVEEAAEVEDSFSVLTRQKYLDPVQPHNIPEQMVSPPIMPQARIKEAPLEAPAQAEFVQPAAASPNFPLTSDQSAAESSDAFNRLADTIIGNATSGDRSIDDITRELLRPMLQSWLDEHLPRVVERLVREEIERVARWGGK